MTPRQVNSAAATTLKASWTPLVNYKVAFAAFGDMLALPRFESFKEALEKSATAMDTFLEKYAIARNKICEVTVARTLSRPIPAGETLEKFLQTAKTSVDILGGNEGLPPALNMRYKAAFESSKP